MNCIEFENVVVGIARDEVMEAAARHGGLAHAESCARCGRRLASEKVLSDAAAAVIAEDATKRAPQYVGKMLMEGFRERKSASQRRRGVWIRRAVTGAVAAMLLMGSAIMLRKTAPAPAVRVDVAAPVDDDTATGDEVTTDFIPLSYDPAPAGATSVVRVELPRAALSAFGLPVNEDRMEDLVRADLLLDQDGLTRAVRFVE